MVRARDEVITRAGQFIPTARGLLPNSFDFEQGFRHMLSRHACKSIP